MCTQLEMQIGADFSYVVTLTLTLDPKINQYASTKCQELLVCRVSSHSDHWFSFYCADIHTHTYIHTLWQSDRNIGSLRDTETILTICTLIQTSHSITTWQTDRQTDRQTERQKYRINIVCYSEAR